VRVVDFLLCFAFGTSASNNNQKAFLHSSVFGTSFPRQKCLVETLPVFVTDGTKIAREEIQVEIQEMYLERHITSHILVWL
jgi:hypothetical protein